MKPLERRIEILKYLQGRSENTPNIGLHFGVVERTINLDVNALRDGYNFFGVHVKIDSYQDNTTDHYYTSNVNPIFLALNMTELTVLMKNLERNAESDEDGVYEHIFDMIYSQLTDYAIDKISPRLSKPHVKEETSNLLEHEHYKNVSYLFKSRSYVPMKLELDGEIHEGLYRIEGIEDDTRNQRRSIYVLHKEGEPRDSLIRVPRKNILIDWDQVTYR